MRVPTRAVGETRANMRDLVAGIAGIDDRDRMSRHPRFRFSVCSATAAGESALFAPSRRFRVVSLP